MFEIRTEIAIGGQRAVFGVDFHQELSYSRTIGRSPDGGEIKIYNAGSEVRLRSGLPVVVYVDNEIALSGAIAKFEVSESSADQETRITVGDGILEWRTSVVSVPIAKGESLESTIGKVASQAGLRVAYVDSSIGSKTAAWKTHCAGTFRRVMSDLLSVAPNAKWVVQNGSVSVFAGLVGARTVPAYELTSTTPFAELPRESGGKLKFSVEFSPRIVPGIAIVDRSGIVASAGTTWRVTEVHSEVSQLGAAAKTDVVAKEA